MSVPKRSLDGTANSGLQLTLDSYEGPLDLLLDLARNQKLDLLEISMSKLAQQYLDFIAHTQSLHVEIAADYLVMATWLTLMKSRLLLPQDDPESEKAQDMADMMRQRLLHLDALRRVSKQLWQRLVLGRDIFAGGQPQGLGVKFITQHKANLHALLMAYAQLQTRKSAPNWAARPTDIISIQKARQHLQTHLSSLENWTSLHRFWLGKNRLSQNTSMALAGGYAASLDLAYVGDLELQQDDLQAPIRIRRKPKPTKRP